MKSKIIMSLAMLFGIDNVVLKSHKIVLAVLLLNWAIFNKFSAGFH